MIVKDKIRQIAERLLQKTRAGEVRWQPDTRDDAACIVNFPNSAVRVSFTSPPVEPDLITLSILDEPGEGGSVGDLTAEEETPDWRLLHDLYDEASRVTTGWDKVLAEIEQAVNSRGPIGLTDSELDEVTAD